jgi:lipoate-protein ligase A
MSVPIRLLDTGLKPARWNIAMTAALAELHRAGAIPDTLRFHRYPRSVLLGRNQVPAHEVDVERCCRTGIEIARRVTGGGTVYMSPGILAWDLVADRGRLGLHLDDAAAIILTAMADGLTRLGLAARCNAPNTITIDGRKVCGASGSFEGPSLLLQGTILVDFDLLEMARVLKATPGSPSAVPNVASLSEFLGHVPADGDVVAALTASLSGALGRPIEAGQAGAEEISLADRLLADEIGTEEFVMGPADAPPATLSKARRGA